MATKKKQSSAPKAAPKAAPKGPTKKEIRKQTISQMLKDARDNREKNKDIIAELREDPDKTEEVRQLLFADLLRVYEIPREILGVSASRARYREHGHYSTSLVTYVFGSWANFKRRAGIESTLGEKAVERNIAKTDRAQIVMDYANRFVKPYNAAFDKLDLTKPEIELQIGGDFHYPYTDPFATRVWMDVAKKHKPDGVRFNGDGPDFPKISRHAKFPGHFPLSLQQEVNGWKDFMGKTRKLVGKDCDLKWILGNHDVRLISAMAEAGALYALDSHEFNEMFELDKLDVGLVARNTFLNPTAKMKKNDIAQNWETIADLFTTVHGFLCGKDAPAKHMRRFMRFGCNSHLHDPALVSGGSDATGVHQWGQTPCMGFPEALGKEYLPGPIAFHGWMPGFLRVTLFPKEHFVDFEFVLCHEVAKFRGQTWRITEEEREIRAAMLEI